KCGKQRNVIGDDCSQRLKFQESIMLPIAGLTLLAFVFGYTQGYAWSKVASIGLSGLFAGLIIFGVQPTVTDQPKVPCWSQMHGMAFFRGLLSLCQGVVQVR